MISRRSALLSLLIAPGDSFRRRFAEIAETLAYTPASKLPSTVKDCSSFLRYCYQEASGQRGRVFYVAPGRKAEFADAEHLMRYNTQRLGTDLRQALPADLLFFRQLEPHQPWHAIVFLGRSVLEPGPERYVVYHTGPDGSHPGEIRRPTIEEMLNHPQPRWRPVPGNANFLGLHRWSILV